MTLTIILFVIAASYIISGLTFALFYSIGVRRSQSDATPLDVTKWILAWPLYIIGAA